MADKDNKTCDHKICSCAVTDDSDYCSPSCEAAGEAAGDLVEIACKCGHSGCAAEL